MLFSCESDDPVPENSEELITTVNLAFTPHGGGATIFLEFKDLDGDGGSAPVINGGTLTAHTVYHATLTLLNESVVPTNDITQEILAEADAHQFFFETMSVQLDHAYDDMDGNGNPIGVVNTFVTGDTSTGTLSVILRHEPDKSAAGVADGDITKAGGETDIEVTFPISVQ